MGNRQTVVGAFVLGGIILALGAIILFGQFNPFSRVVRAVVVLQGSASGLSIGAPVTFRGVPLGSVSNIELTFDRRSFHRLYPGDAGAGPAARAPHRHEGNHRRGGTRPPRLAGGGEYSKPGDRAGGHRTQFRPEHAGRAAPRAFAIPRNPCPAIHHAKDAANAGTTAAAGDGQQI